MRQQVPAGDSRPEWTAFLPAALRMSRWVEPTFAAELWGVPLDRVLDQIRAGEVPARTDDGFLLVDVGSAGWRAHDPRGVIERCLPAADRVDAEQAPWVDGDGPAHFSPVRPWSRAPVEAQIPTAFISSQPLSDESNPWPVWDSRPVPLPPTGNEPSADELSALEAALASEPAAVVVETVPVIEAGPAGFPVEPEPPVYSVPPIALAPPVRKPRRRNPVGRRAVAPVPVAPAPVETPVIAPPVVAPPVVAPLAVAPAAVEVEDEMGPDPNFGEVDDGRPLDWRQARVKAASRRRPPPRFG
jgi:hypothetical protein